MILQKTIPIFIGYDERERAATNVLIDSLYQTSSIPIAITPLVTKQLRNLGILVSIFYFTLIFLAEKFFDLSPLDVTKDNPVINNGESIFEGIISNI